MLKPLKRACGALLLLSALGLTGCDELLDLFSSAVPGLPRASGVGSAGPGYGGGGGNGQVVGSMFSSGTPLQYPTRPRYTPLGGGYGGGGYTGGGGYSGGGGYYPSGPRSSSVPGSSQQVPGYSGLTAAGEVDPDRRVVPVTIQHGPATQGGTRTPSGVNGSSTPSRETVDSNVVDNGSTRREDPSNSGGGQTLDEVLQPGPALYENGTRAGTTMVSHTTQQSPAVEEAPATSASQQVEEKPAGGFEAVPSQVEEETEFPDILLEQPYDRRIDTVASYDGAPMRDMTTLS